MPLLVGQTFTEQSHILDERDSFSLQISSLDECRDQSRVKLICISYTIIDRMTTVDFMTDPTYTGEVYIDGSMRYQVGHEHYNVQELFTVCGGLGAALVRGMSSPPFTLNKGSLLARCKRPELAGPDH